MNLSEPFTAGDMGGARVWNRPEFGAGPPPTARALENVSLAAREEGFNQGRLEGLARGTEEARALTRCAASIVDQLARPLSSVDSAVEHLLVGLCMQIGQQLALRELKSAPEALAALVREAVGQLTLPAREVRVSLHPEDLAALQSVLDPASTPHWRLEPDPQLARGDCLVATDTAAVDAKMHRRVAEIARSLFEE
jgi:flagellar assembly protein FliH